MDHVKVIKWLGWWLFNVSFEDFKAFMEKHGITHENGVNDQWDRMKNNQMHWWMNLDEEMQKAVVEAAVQKYSQWN